MSNTAVILKKSQSDELGRILTRELRSILKEKGLYDTGKLDKSIKFTVRVNKGTATMNITITSEHYLKYHLKEYRIIETLESSSAYKKCLDLYVEFTKQNILDDLFLNFKQLKKS